jgi:hypothetical protein
MKAWWRSLLIGGFSLCGAAPCLAQQAAAAEPQPAPSAPASPPTDRLTLSGDGATLTNTNGGGGGSVGYLHGFGPQLLAGAGVEYQKLYDANWTFGSLNAAYSHPLTATTTWNLHGEIHEGTGHVAEESFRYGIEALGIGSSIPGGFALDLEERQIDVFTSHGSLPKASLAKAWGTRWLTTVALAHSFGGNLNTNYTLARIDYYGSFVNLLAGGSIGRVNPVVLGINGVLEGQTLHSHEAFAGVTKRFGRFDLSLLGDYIDLEGNKHFIGTLTGTWYLR